MTCDAQQIQGSQQNFCLESVCWPLRMCRRLFGIFKKGRNGCITPGRSLLWPILLFIASLGPDTEKGDPRIDELSRDYKSGSDAHLFAEVIEQINVGDMPPEGEPQPSKEEILVFVAKLDAFIEEGKASRMAACPPAAHYRLSQKEFENSVPSSPEFQSS